MRKHFVFTLSLIIGLMASLIMLGFYVHQVRAADLHVDPNGITPGGYSCYESINTAIQESRDGDVIILEPGVYKENIGFLGKPITVKSTNPDDPNVVGSTIIDGGQMGECCNLQ